MVLGYGLRPLEVVFVILTVRILSVYLVQTWYVPDEYWQTLEVAHKTAFGYGALTWEWQKGIRSYLYPGVVSALYTVLKFTGLDYPEVLVILPRILQAVISTAADYSLYKWTGERKWALYLILTSWFWFYTCSRTLLQTLETCLVAIGLSTFPFKGGVVRYYEKESHKWIWVGVLSVFLRPTSLPIWAVLGAYNLLTTNQGRLRLFVRTYVPIGLIVGGALVALDSYFYGRFIVTPWEFVKFNVLHDIASHYGTHPWHWYFSQGVPAVLGVNIIPVLVSVVNIVRRPRENVTGQVLLIATASYLVLYSFIPHKEFRFVLPLFPIFIYFAQDAIVPWSRKAKTWQLYLVAGTLLFGNMLPASYFGIVHQSGTMKVMPLIREALPNNRSSVVFLMPCHSTPLYSHLHMNITARYLSCDPFDHPGSTTEAEAFYNNPLRWWNTEYSTRQTPNLVVLFDTLKGRIENILKGYSPLYEIPHTQFPEGEVGKNVLLYQKIEKQPKPLAADETV